MEISSNREQPRINTSTIDVPALRELSEGTFGKEYTKFLDKNVSKIRIIVNCYTVCILHALGVELVCWISQWSRQPFINLSGKARNLVL